MPPRQHRWSIVIATALVLGACTSSGGTSAAVDRPTIEEAWVRPAPAGADTAAYLTITGVAEGADALTSASSPGAAQVELHEVSTDTAGMTGMHPIARLEVPAGGTVRLQPGGFHLMVSGLVRELTIGGTLELVLVFERAGTVKVQAKVRTS